jgi:hypothetical protein
MVRYCTTLSKAACSPVVDYAPSFSSQCHSIRMSIARVWQMRIRHLLSLWWQICRTLLSLQRHQYHCFMRICIRCDVLEKNDNVVGRTRDQRRVCGGVGQCEGLSLWHANVRVSYNRALHCVSKCTTTSSEAGRGCGFDAGCAC